MTTGNRYDDTVRMAFLEEYNGLPLGLGGRRSGVGFLRKKYGIAHATADRWIKQQGVKQTPGRKPRSTSKEVTEVYFLGDLKFRTKEAAVRYAVEAMGGLKVQIAETITTLKKVEL